MSFLSSLLQRLVEILEPYGAPGLLLIAIADSSFLSLPEVNDLALMTLSIANPSRMWILAVSTIIGSIIGCTLLYTVGRKGGEALLTKRFAAAKVARVRAWYDKYGMLAIIVPSLLPPPLPFKIFVLCAGAFRISWAKFMIAVGIGRSIRYFTEGLLAVWYGKQAIQMVKDNSGRVGVVLASLIVAGTLVFVYSRRRRLGSSAVLLPLAAVVLLSGCVRTETTPESRKMKPSFPFTRAQALDRLARMSQIVQSLDAPIGFSGSTPDLKDPKNKRKVFSGLTGYLHMQRPGQVNLDVTATAITIFEMVSNGSQYELYIPYNKKVHVGSEEGPPVKSSCEVGETANQFVNMKPHQILDALMPDFRSELNSPSIRTVAYVFPVILDQKRYFIVDFLDVSSPSETRITQKVWFDLSTPDVEIVRRQTFAPDGEVERDTRFEAHSPIGTIPVRYATRFNVHFVPSDTFLTITMDSKLMTLNPTIDPDAFVLGTHRNAEICRLEPAPAAVVRQ